MKRFAIASVLAVAALSSGNAVARADDTPTPTPGATQSTSPPPPASTSATPATPGTTAPTSVSPSPASGSPPPSGSTPAVTNTTLPTPTPIESNTTTPSNGSHTSKGSTSALLAAISKEKPLAIFKESDALKELAPISNVAPEVLTKKAIPTNNWWGNLIATDTKKPQLTQPAWANPYAIKFGIEEAPFGLQVSYPEAHKSFCPESTNNGDAKKCFIHGFEADIVLSATEFGGAAPTFAVHDWDDLAVQVKMCGKDGGSSCVDLSLVNGMGFVSATFNGQTPQILSKGQVPSVKADPSMSGKYEVQIGQQKWTLYAIGKDGAAANVTFSAGDKGIVASAPFTGTVRVAILPAGVGSTALDAYASCVVQGGVVNVASRTSYSFDLMTTGKCDKGLLHFALTHHVETMKTPSPTGVVTMQSSTRGPMTGIVTPVSSNQAQWVFEEPESATKIEFYPPRKISADIVTKYELKETLTKEINDKFELGSGSWYFVGKKAQMYASLCLMAKDEAIVGKDTALLQTCLTKLQEAITPLLTNTIVNPLLYDTVYRGIISSEGITKKDLGADFGNSGYNDHHYHYGYWITASAMLRYLNPSWEKMKDLEAVVTTMIRDVANPSDEDTYFPRFRQFSWYNGHSYSHGCTLVGDGKDEESTSEDVNFHYGMMLWGIASKNKQLEDLGSLMLHVDAHAIRTYVLMDSTNKVQPKEILGNHVLGIFYDNKVDYATFFSKEKWAIHGIQMIPVSPINEIVRTQKFIKEEWDDILSKEASCMSKSPDCKFLSLLAVNYANVDMNKGLDLLKGANMDDGLSRSWATYIAGTRPGAGEAVMPSSGSAGNATTASSGNTTTGASASPTPTPVPTTPATTTIAPGTTASSTPAPGNTTPAPGNTTPAPGNSSPAPGNTSPVPGSSSSAPSVPASSAPAPTTNTPSNGPLPPTRA